MKILVVASLTTSLLNFRRTLLEDFVAVPGAEVVALAPERDDATCAELSAMGVRFQQIPMARASTNPIGDLRTFAALAGAIRTERPDIIIAYTQKPIIYGGLAARIFGRARFFALQSGLGFVYSAENTNSALRRFVSFLYRLALAKAEAVFVFNGADHADMLTHGIITSRHKVIQVAGSGVDPQRYEAVAVPEGAPTFLLVARMMKDKGLFEFAEAARQVKSTAPHAQFQILGPYDANPAGVQPADIEKWTSEGVIDYLGETKDVRPFLAQSTVFVLPSYHREGLPRSILEAMSTGRAIVTTDMPGCRETVIEGENGFIVPPQDADALAKAMKRFVDEPELAAKLGARSRRRVEDTFDVRLVNDKILGAMGLSGDAPPAPARRRVSLAERVFDVLIGGIGLVAAAPLIALVAIAVFFTLGRPVLFHQKRAGRDGRTFKLVKFRTMSNERDADGALLPDDQRLSGFGRLLRRLRLDELPELWNILVGEMAVVGPRPLLPDAPPNQGAAGAERLSARPGLTGWAQVNGNASLSDEDKLQLDLWYVRNRSLKLDAYIVLRTIRVVFEGEKINTANIKAAYESNHRRSC